MSMETMKVLSSYQNKSARERERYAQQVIREYSDLGHQLETMKSSIDLMKHKYGEEIQLFHELQIELDELVEEHRLVCDRYFTTLFSHALISELLTHQRTSLSHSLTQSVSQ